MNREEFKFEICANSVESCLAGMPIALKAATVKVLSSPHLPYAERIVARGAEVRPAEG